MWPSWPYENIDVVLIFLELVSYQKRLVTSLYKNSIIFVKKIN